MKRTARIGAFLLFFVLLLVQAARASGADALYVFKDKDDVLVITNNPLGGMRAPCRIQSERGRSPAKRPACGLSAETDRLALRAARHYGLDHALIRAVIEVESGGDPLAVSSKGAMGLMQLMPETAASLGVSDPFNPARNIHAGACYLRQLLDRFGDDVRLALAAYNAGPAAVERHGGIPPIPETRRYVQKVIRIWGGSIR